MNRGILFGLAFALAATLAGLVILLNRDASAFNWERSYDAAMERARAQDRHAIAYLYTDWCAYCKQMEAETFSDKRVSEQAGKYVWLKLNPEEDADGARLHKKFQGS